MKIPPDGKADAESTFLRHIVALSRSERMKLLRSVGFTNPVVLKDDHQVGALIEAFRAGDITYPPQDPKPCPKPTKSTTASGKSAPRPSSNTTPAPFVPIVQVVAPHHAGYYTPVVGADGKPDQRAWVRDGDSAQYPVPWLRVRWAIENAQAKVVQGKLRALPGEWRLSPLPPNGCFAARQPKPQELRAWVIASREYCIGNLGHRRPQSGEVKQGDIIVWHADGLPVPLTVTSDGLDDSLLLFATIPPAPVAPETPRRTVTPSPRVAPPQTTPKPSKRATGHMEPASDDMLEVALWL